MVLILRFNKYEKMTNVNTIKKNVYILYHMFHVLPMLWLDLNLHFQISADTSITYISKNKDVNSI